MKEFKDTLAGFILFFLTTIINVTLAIIIFYFVQHKSTWMIAISIIALVIVMSLFMTIFDYFRRKTMITKPLKEILDATESLAKGTFDFNIRYNHSYENFDEFDLIKDYLKKMANELKKNQMINNDFISNVSHEIKTPLSVITNYAKLLENEKLTKEERKQYLNNLKHATKKLSDLVTNILRLNKLENQKLIPEIKRFNLSELIINKIIQYESIIEEKNIELDVNIQEDLYINSEESYIEIIVNNLLTNAIKFTNEKGTISVSLQKNKNEYEIKVKDTGIGMNAETGKHIFDKFYQGDTSHHKEGNGLGLSLVKKVIDIIGGSISVESEINKGTTFIVLIKEN